MSKNTPPVTDKEGFLVSLSDWSETVAEFLAVKEGIVLTNRHLEIILLLRQFYQDHELSPSMRVFVKIVKAQLGEEKGNSLYLLSLFPESPAKIACKIAGLPKPTNCL